MSPFMVITSSPYLRQLMQVNILPKEKCLIYYSVRLNFLHRGFSWSNWNCLQEKYSLERRLSNPKSRELVCETWDCYSPSAGGKPRVGGMWSLSSPHHMLHQQELIIDSPGRTSHLPQTATSGTLAEMWRKGTYESWAFNWSWERERKWIFLLVGLHIPLDLWSLKPGCWPSVLQLSTEYASGCWNNLCARLSPSVRSGLRSQAFCFGKTQQHCWIKDIMEIFGKIATQLPKVISSESSWGGLHRRC